jgi:uncharacterized membrane protein YjjB (DUF3815 family)
MINIILCISGTFGFCAVLNVPKNKIIPICIGATISATIFEVLYNVADMGTVISTTTATLAIGIYSEAMARILKTPATVILLPSTIPLLPGGTLYYAMSYLVAGAYEDFLYYAKETIYTGFSIAIGSIITAIAVKLIYTIIYDKL